MIRYPCPFEVIIFVDVIIFEDDHIPQDDQDIYEDDQLVVVERGLFPEVFTKMINCLEDDHLKGTWPSSRHVATRWRRSWRLANVVARSAGRNTGERGRRGGAGTP